MTPSSLQALFAAQAKLRHEMGLVRIPAQRNPSYRASGPRSYVSLLHKFGFQPTKPGKYRFEERRRLAQRGLAGGKFTAGGRAQFVFQRMLVKAAEDGTTGEVTSEDQQNDAVYLSPVQIGTPAQTLMLDCDTGSADLWVFSTGMPAETQRGHTTYDASLSSSWKDMPRYSWKVKYADESSASGSCGTDTVGLGGLQVTGQVIELAQQASMTLVSRSGDGMLGLGFSTINTVIKDGDHDPQATAVDNMITQKDIPADARLFTSCLYSDRDAGKQSFFTFGWIDQDLVSASGKDIVWTPIDSSQGFWKFPSTTYTINGKQSTQSGNTAIADTGTTLALLSDTAVDALYSQIPGATYSNEQQGYIFPTSLTADQLPKFSIAVGDTEFVIQPEDFALASVDSRHWYGAIQSRGDNQFDILGDAFLKSIYAIWDQGNLRFGAAPKIEKYQNMTPASS